MRWRDVRERADDVDYKHIIKMAAPILQWIVSQKGKEKFIIDDYTFICNGKGKTMSAPNVRYWSCQATGCAVKAKTSGNQLVDLTGVTNPPDHGHVNDVQLVSDLHLKVRLLKSLI